MLQPLETNATILIIDDQESNLRLLERVLISAGYHAFVSSTDPLKAVDLYRQYRPISSSSTCTCRCSTASACSRS